MFRAVLLGLLVFSTALVQTQGAEPDRPNIVWLSTEDISPQLGCYGEKHAITPTLDQLAADGVRYTNAYTIAGVCAPNRTGIILGMYPTSVGGHHMRCKATLPDHIRCFPAYLREAGYYCTNNSKTDYNFGVSVSQVLGRFEQEGPLEKPSRRQPLLRRLQLHQHPRRQYSRHREILCPEDGPTHRRPASGSRRP